MQANHKQFNHNRCNFACSVRTPTFPIFQTDRWHLVTDTDENRLSDSGTSGRASRYVNKPSKVTSTAGCCSLLLMWVNDMSLVWWANAGAEALRQATNGAFLTTHGTCTVSENGNQRTQPAVAVVWTKCISLYAYPVGSGVITENNWA